MLVFATLLLAAGCAQRYQVPSADLMRGAVMSDLTVETSDGYRYDFSEGQVRGDTFFGTLVEDIEEVGEDGDLHLTTVEREIPIPLSSVIRVDGVRRGVSSNTLYLAGALGASAVIYSVVSSGDDVDVSTRGTGPAGKDIP
jgi:hypothetical protein